MKKLLSLGLMIIFETISLPEMQAMERVKPISIDERSKVFETYYLHDPQNNDPSIFIHMNVWHEEDYKAVISTVQELVNQEKLKKINNTLNQAFKEGTATYSKIVMTYLVYAMVMSSKSEMENAEDAEDDEDIDHTIQKVSEFFEKGELYDYNERNSGKYNFVLRQIVYIDKYNLRWLPYVSKKGEASFRTLNSQFGMKAPLAGLPLGRVAYDGHLNGTPYNFFGHEINHAGFFDSGAGLETIEPAYAYYYRADSLVRKITNPKIQALCDFFLFEVGHEQIFKIVWGGTYSDKEQKWIGHVFQPKNLDDCCDKALESLAKNVQQICQSALLDHQWDILAIISLGRSWNGPVSIMSESHNAYYEKTSMLRHFMNPQKPGHLFSLSEIIIQNGFSKTQPLDERILIIPASLNVPVLELASYEFERWWGPGGALGINTYNQFMGLKKFFNKHGIAFDLWKDDEFQAGAIIAVLKEAYDSFKKEVVSKIGELGS
ncbi:MAG: hypothetical protein ACOH2E_06425 [Candidatus Paracaedibacter sp.]